MPGSIASVSSDPPRLLLVSPNWIGDAVMAMPAVQSWRAAHPRAHLTVLARGAVATLWQLHTAPNKVLAYQREAWRAAARAARDGGFTEACLLPNSFRTALLVARAGIPCRRGAPGHLRRWLLHRVVDPQSVPQGRRHQCWENAELLMPDAVPEALPHPSLTLPPSAVEEAAALLAGLPRPLLAVMPGAARGPSKRWPVAHFLAVAHRWQGQESGGVVLLGGPEDATACREMAVALGAGARSLAGSTSLAVWAALLAAADAAVANDSGGTHLAAALGTPTAAVFGMTDPEVTGPLGPRVCVVQAPGRRSRAVARHSHEAEKRLAAVSAEQVYEAMVCLRKG